MNLNRSIDITKLMAACAHFTAAQLGAAMRLSAHMLVAGALPTQPSKLSRVVGIPSNKWGDTMEQVVMVVRMHHGFVMGYNRYPESGGKKDTMNHGVKSTPRMNVSTHSKSDINEVANDAALARPSFINNINNNIIDNNRTSDVKNVTDKLVHFESPDHMVRHVTNLSSFQVACMHLGLYGSDLQNEIEQWAKLRWSQEFQDNEHVINSWKHHVKVLFQSKKIEPAPKKFAKPLAADDAL